MRNVLVKAMREKRITNKDVAKALGVHYNTASLKLHQKESRDLSLSEAVLIHNKWFPEYDFAELFSINTTHNQ